jgi:thiol-disulfide isomerase/thioredoxin
MKRSAYLFATIVVLILLSACSASQSKEPPAGEAATAETVIQPETIESESTDVSMSESEEIIDEGATEAETSEEMMEDPPAEAEEMDDAEMMTDDRPAWQQIALTNARTGETFTLADFEGQTIFVEPMATWCGNCRRQLNSVRGAKEQLAGEDVVFVALSVETNIDDSALASYANGEGFDWLFAVVTPEMLGLLADEFGRSIANPPATPHFIIRADGSNTDLVTGIEPSDQIVAQIIAAQG